MKLLLPLTALACFIWLAVYSLSAQSASTSRLDATTPTYDTTDAATGYTSADRKALDRLIAQEVGQPSQPARTRASDALMRKQARALQTVYGITDSEIAKPINLFK